MKTEFYYDSQGEGRIHGCRWTPDGEIRAVVQIIHGIAEHVERYDDFANYLNSLGILVVAEDHMGHGKSMETGTRGYFAGGWTAAVEDSYQLLQATRLEFTAVPYILFGHSMGSFMARTILIRHPDSGISGAILCGTGWTQELLLTVGRAACKAVCKSVGERNPSEQLQNLVFGSYNKRVEHPRTAYDWLSRDKRQVDAYIADPNCGFTASSGLLRDMLGGIAANQKKENLVRMKKELPVLLISGGDDPVGGYGEGVERTAEEFQKAGMKKVDVRLIPLARHELLNEMNKEDVYKFVSEWVDIIVAASRNLE